MGNRRKPNGRTTAQNAGFTNRTVGKVTASHAPGSGFWRRSHGDKVPFTRFCEALKMERTARRTRALNGDRPSPREVYPCGYGHHYLITGPRHWHIGRPLC